MKLKIGILTFHYAINYGAVLQTYALKTTLCKLGHEVHVIHYVNSKMFAEASPFFVPHGVGVVARVIHAVRLPMHIKTSIKFKKYVVENLDLSGDIISTSEDLRKLSKYYDKIITGSDQVFNYIGTGEDFNFYLEFIDDNRKKIAYAPSFGLSLIDETHKMRVKKCLDEIQFLTVREQVGQDIIRSLTGRKVPTVCDPTFLLETSEWKAAKKNFAVKKPYVLVYSIGSIWLENAAWKLANEIGAEVINVNRALPSGVKGKAKTAYAPDPAEFLSLIDNAMCVVTNSFHGTALSVLLQKDVYVALNNYSNSAATNNRFSTLLGNLGLSDRIFNPDMPPRYSPIDFAVVNKTIMVWREESLTILKQALC